MTNVIIVCQARRAPCCFITFETLCTYITIAIGIRTAAGDAALHQAGKNKHRLCIRKCNCSLLCQISVRGNISYIAIQANLQHGICCFVLSGTCFLDDICNGIILSTIMHGHPISSSLIVGCRLDAEPLIQ